MRQSEKLLLYLLWNEDEERRYGNTRRLLNLANDLGYKVSNILIFLSVRVSLCLLV